MFVKWKSACIVFRPRLRSIHLCTRWVREVTQSTIYDFFVRVPTSNTRLSPVYYYYSSATPHNQQLFRTGSRLLWKLFISLITISGISFWSQCYCDSRAIVCVLQWLGVDADFVHSRGVSRRESKKARKRGREWVRERGERERGGARNRWRAKERKGEIQ